MIFKKTGVWSAILILEILFVLSWSSGFIGAKFGSKHLATFELLWLRYLAVFLILAMFLLLRGKARISLSSATFRYASVTGFLGQTICLSCIFYAIAQGLPAGTAALIAGLQPLLTAVLAGPLLGERVRLQQWIGLALGLAGGLIVAFSHTAFVANSGATATIYILPFVAVISLTLCTLHQKRCGDDVPLLECLTIQSAMNMAIFFLLHLCLEDGTPSFDKQALLAVVWLAIFTTLGAYGLLGLLLKKTNITRVASLIFLEPPVTMLWAYFQFGEVITPLGFLGIFVVGMGVMLIYRKYKPGGSEVAGEPAAHSCNR